MPYTMQEAFDTVLQKLRAQRCRSVKFNEKFGREICAYRGDNGMKCGIGHLIPDDEYQPVYDEDALRARYVMAPALEGLPRDLLTSLQTTHDCCMPSPGANNTEARMAEFEDWMADIAKSFHLTYAPPAGVAA